MSTFAVTIKDLIVTGLMSALVSCQSASTETDAKDSTATAADTVAAPAYERIVTVGGTATETVFALGYGSKVVARDRTSIYPPEVNELPSVGHPGNMSAESILTENPDLIVAADNFAGEEVVEQLRESEVEMLVLEDGYSAENTEAMIRKVGEKLGAAARADTLITEMRRELEVVQERLATAPTRPKVLFIYARGRGALNVGGRGTFAAKLIEMAGGQLATPEIEEFKPLNTEALVAANPDYVLFFDSGLESVGGVDGAVSLPGIDATTAGQQRQIIALPGDLLANFGPRLGEATRRLTDLIHPKDNATASK